jgi:hypothetical protein
VGRKLYSFVHFEAVVPSTVYFLELQQDPQNGALKVIQQMVRRLRNVHTDARCMHGIHQPLVGRQWTAALHALHAIRLLRGAACNQAVSSHAEMLAAVTHRPLVSMVVVLMHLRPAAEQAL